MRRTATAVAGLALVAQLAVAPRSSAQSIPANVNASRIPASQAEAAIAVNPTDPSDVVIVSNTNGKKLFLGVSHDGGQTFLSRNIAVGGRLGNACCDPTLSWDGFGNLFLAWLDYTDSSALPVALSTDGGDTFRLLAVLHPKRPQTAASGLAVRGLANGREGRREVFIDQPTVTTGPGSVWLVWNNSGQIQATGARVSGLGGVGRFHRPETAPGTLRCNFGDIAIGPTGQVEQVCTHNRRNGGEPPTAGKIIANLDPDGFGPAGFGPPVLVGRMNVAQFDAVPPQRARTIDSEAGLAWDRTGGAHEGRLYLVYTTEHPDESDNTDIELRFSDDDGLTWSRPVMVNDDRNDGRTQMLPRVALDETSGTIAVGWHDSRNDNGDLGFGDTDGRPNSDAMYYMAFSYDGGGTFAPNVQVSAGASNATSAKSPVDFGDYTGLAFVAGVAHPAWADNSNSTGDNPAGALGSFDIYTASVPA